MRLGFMEVFLDNSIGAHLLYSHSLVSIRWELISCERTGKVNEDPYTRAFVPALSDCQLFLLTRFVLATNDQQRVLIEIYLLYPFTASSYNVNRSMAVSTG